MKRHLVDILALGLLLSGQWQWLVGWCLFSMVLCGLSYVWLGPAILNKSADGDIPFINRLANAPWLWEYRIIVALDRWLGFEGVHEISPGLWLGRRLLAREVPKDIKLVVDLTAESSKIEDLAAEVSYMCLPTLDGYAPETNAFMELVDKVSQHPGPVLIHCARGHGRSATAMAAVLIKRGLATDVDTAYALMKSKRKRVHLHRRQLKLLSGVSLERIV